MALELNIPLEKYTRTDLFGNGTKKKGWGCLGSANKSVGFIISALRILNRRLDKSEIPFRFPNTAQQSRNSVLHRVPSPNSIRPEFLLRRRDNSGRDGDPAERKHGKSLNTKNHLFIKLLFMNVNRNYRNKLRTSGSSTQQRFPAFFRPPAH